MRDETKGSLAVFVLCVWGCFAYHTIWMVLVTWLVGYGAICDLRKEGT